MRAYEALTLARFAERFDPAQVRAPAGTPIAGEWIRDPLKLASRIHLDPGEVLAGSDVIESPDGDLLAAVTHGPGGRHLRLGVGILDEDRRRWRGANRGATVVLDEAAQERLRTAAEDMKATARDTAARGRQAMKRIDDLEVSRRTMIRKQYPGLSKDQAAQLDRIDADIDEANGTVAHLRSRIDGRVAELDVPDRAAYDRLTADIDRAKADRSTALQAVSDAGGWTSAPGDVSDRYHAADRRVRDLLDDRRGVFWGLTGFELRDYDDLRGRDRIGDLTPDEDARRRAYYDKAGDRVYRGSGNDRDLEQVDQKLGALYRLQGRREELTVEAVPLSAADAAELAQVEAEIARLWSEMPSDSDIAEGTVAAQWGDLEYGVYLDEDFEPHYSLDIAANRNTHDGVRLDQAGLAKLVKLLAAEHRTEADAPVVDEVYDYLAENYPPKVLGWVRDADWSGPVNVELSDVDMARRPGGRNQAKVEGIAQAVRDGKEMDPVVLVRTPGDEKLVVADGFHRTLAFQRAGKSKIPAYVGEVDSDEGPWDRAMHDAKLNTGVKESLRAHELFALARWAESTGIVDSRGHIHAPKGPGGGRFVKKLLTGADEPHVQTSRGTHVATAGPAKRAAAPRAKRAPKPVQHDEPPQVAPSPAGAVKKAAPRKRTPARAAKATPAPAAPGRVAARDISRDHDVLAPIYNANIDEDGGWVKSSAGDLALIGLARQQGFDAPPTVLSSADFDRAVADRGHAVMYRGINPESFWGEDNWEKKLSGAQVHAQTREGDYQPGYGVFGNGYYFATDKEKAESFSDGQPGSLGRYALGADARVIDYEDLLREYGDWFDSDWHSESVETQGMTTDFGRYAAARGFDAIRVPVGTRILGGGTVQREEWVVLNRGALIADGGPS